MRTYFIFNEQDEKEVLDFFFKHTRRTDIRKFDLLRNFENPNQLLLRHKFIQEDSFRAIQDVLGDKIEIHKENFRNEKQRTDFYANYRHRQHLSFNLVKGLSLEQLELPPDSLSDLTSEEIAKFSV